MINTLRNKFNSEFSKDHYQRILELLEKGAGEAPEFRISESPIFLSNELKKKLLEVSESIIDQLASISREELALAIPPHLKVPGKTNHLHFIAIDFGLCHNAQQEVEPQLIELQGFASLFSFQHFFSQTLRSEYPWLKELSGISEVKDPIGLLKKVILSHHASENVVLLELHPEKQKTRIDFHLTEDYLGIETVCVTKVEKEGRMLYYWKNGVKTPIHRIYNRVIFDELDRENALNLNFSFQEDLNVEWVAHPNWFFMISKYLLPSLEHKYIPKTYFAHEFPAKENIKDYVLKPLFSFAGSGVNLHPTEMDLKTLKKPSQFIVQKKVSYAPLFTDINGEKAKAEIRLLYLWEDSAPRPELTDCIVRMTKSEMANVDFNRNANIWTGSSVAFFTKEGN